MQELVKQRIVGYCYCGGRVRRMWRGEYICEQCGEVYQYPPRRHRFSVDDLEHAINSAIEALQRKGVAPTLQRIYSLLCWCYGVSVPESQFQRACVRLGLL